jgi:hypothetical protein
VDFDDAHRFDVNVQLQQSGLTWENDQRNAPPVDRMSQELGALSLGHGDMMAQYYGKQSTPHNPQQIPRLTRCQWAMQQEQDLPASSSRIWI